LFTLTSMVMVMASTPYTALPKVLMSMGTNFYYWKRKRFQSCA
jgi:hypothetical protein